MYQLILRVITRWAILYTLCLQIIPSRADESSPPAYVPDSKKQDAWLFGKNRTYDEWFVQRRSVHTKDL